MNRVIKEAAVEVFHYPDLDALKAQVLALLDGLQLHQTSSGFALENFVQGAL